jgi:hypothetical protein
MKAYVIALLAVLPATAGLSQGELNFANLGGHVDAPIYDIDGTAPLAGPGFLAGLYAAPVGQSLAPVGNPVAFLTAFPGYFLGGATQVPGVPAGGTAAVQVVAWRASDGPTYALANHPGGHVGGSGLLDVTLASPTANPSFLIGLQSFSLHEVVPEPSVFALGLLVGCTAILCRGPRRRARHRSAEAVEGKQSCGEPRLRRSDAVGFSRKDAKARSDKDLRGRIAVCCPDQTVGLERARGSLPFPSISATWRLGARSPLNRSV